MSITWVFNDHRVEQGAQYCSCGQDAVTCQDCGATICGNFATWRDQVTHRGNRCERCMQRVPRPISGKPWIESVLDRETYARCTECRQVHVLVIAKAAVMKWAQGELIQRAMPALEVAAREILVSGLCSSCFDRIFKGDDKDETDERPVDVDDFCHALEDLLKTADRADFPQVRDVESFSSAGLLTSNEGIVVRMQNGKTFHVTISEA
jgi:DNA-directed RNA polymerase subunit RPC12/RpoP